MIYFQQNSVAQVISTFLFFPLYCRNYCSLRLSHYDDLLLLHREDHLLQCLAITMIKLNAKQVFSN